MHNLALATGHWSPASGHLLATGKMDSCDIQKKPVTSRKEPAASSKKPETNVLS